MTTPAPILSPWKTGRMDFTMKVAGIDHATRTLSVLISPDPRRYDKVVHDGKEWCRDKYLQTLVSLDDMCQAMHALPVYELTPTIGSAARYAIERKLALDQELATGKYTPPQQRAKPHQQVESDSSSRSISFMSVDICGGTALRKKDPGSFERAHALFMRELGNLGGTISWNNTEFHRRRFHSLRRPPSLY